MQAQTINLNLTLASWKISLLNSLAKKTDLEPGYFLNQILTRKSTWTDLDDLNDVLKIKQDPQQRSLSGVEANNYLNLLDQQDVAYKPYSAHRT